jgi:hypothetical protein
VSSRDLKRGKSGGFRVIYAWTAGQPILYPLFIYFKGEKEDITKEEIENLLRKLLIPQLSEKKSFIELFR